MIPGTSLFLFRTGIGGTIGWKTLKLFRHGQINRFAVLMGYAINAKRARSMLGTDLGQHPAPVDVLLLPNRLVQQMNVPL